jgi:hypothetical protein
VSFTRSAFTYPPPRQYDEDSLVYSGIDCEDEGDGVYEEADEVVGETTQPDQHSVLPVREVYLPEQALPSPALTGTSSLGSFPRPRSPPVSLEGPPEDLATVQDPPTPEDLPKTEEPPASGNLELFITEARPVGEEMPVVVELPPVQESPAVDESLVIEEPPSIEEPPVAEELLIVEEPRTAEESLVAEQPPFIEEPPIVEGLLTNEGVAFPMDGLAMKEGHPLLDEEPLRQNAPSQEELFVSGASPTLSNRTTSSVQDELPVQIEESPPQESTTLATTAIVEELVASEDFPSPVQESESKSASPAEHLHPSFDLPDEEPFSELSSLADNVSVARSGTEDETSEENSGDESHSDDSLSSLSDFDGDSQAANDPNGPRRSKRSRTHVASYNYRRRKRPRRDKEENASSSTPPAGDSISAAGSGSRGRTLSAKAEDRPTASGDFSKQRKKHQPGYFTARQRRQTLADQKRRVELAEEVADWPFRTKKAGAYSNVSGHCSCGWRTLIGPSSGSCVTIVRDGRTMGALASSPMIPVSKRTPNTYVHRAITAMCTSFSLISLALC